MTDDMDAEESYRMWFGVFIQALQALSYDPVAACNKMGNYNSAGEIWYELTSLDHLAASPFIGLTNEQQAAIALLSYDLKAVPAEAMAPGGVMPTSHAACVIVMQHPAWVPLREQAARLVEMLEPTIKRNQEFLNSL
jgi:hypothetical protein